MKNKLRILLVSVLSVLAMCALLLAGCGDEHTHTYGEASWTWTEVYDEDGETLTGYTAVATISCTEGDSTLTSNSVTAEYAEITAATEDTAGEGQYTATVTLNGTEYTGTKTVALPATGSTPAAHTHTYGEVEWTWTAISGGYTATASVTCTDTECGDTLEETALVTDTVNAATCTAAGSTVYTATATLNGQTVTDTKTVEGDPATGHSYGNVVWTWAEVYAEDGETVTGYTATATLACSAGDSTLSETVDGVYTIVTSATEENEGEGRYTATVTLNGTEYTTAGDDIKTVTIPVVTPGHVHTYGAVNWTWAEVDGVWQATAQIVCTANDSTLSETAAGAVSSSTEATCAKAGSVTYTATVTLNGKTYTTAGNDLKTVEIPATGKHTNSWSNNNVVCSVCGATLCENATEFTKNDENSGSLTVNLLTDYTLSYVVLGTGDYTIKLPYNNSTGKFTYGHVEYDSVAAFKAANDEWSDASEQYSYSSTSVYSIDITFETAGDYTFTLTNDDGNYYVMIVFYDENGDLLQDINRNYVKVGWMTNYDSASGTYTVLVRTYEDDTTVKMTVTAYDPTNALDIETLGAGQIGTVGDVYIEGIWTGTLSYAYAEDTTGSSTSDPEKWYRNLITWTTYESPYTLAANEGHVVAYYGFWSYQKITVSEGFRLYTLDDYNDWTIEADSVITTINTDTYYYFYVKNIGNEAASFTLYVEDYTAGTTYVTREGTTELTISSSLLATGAPVVFDADYGDFDTLTVYILTLHAEGDGAYIGIKASGSSNAAVECGYGNYSGCWTYTFTLGDSSGNAVSKTLYFFYYGDSTDENITFTITVSPYNQLSSVSTSMTAQSGGYYLAQYTAKETGTYRLTLTSSTSSDTGEYLVTVTDVYTLSKEDETEAWTKIEATDEDGYIYLLTLSEGETVYLKICYTSSADRYTLSATVKTYDPDKEEDPYEGYIEIEELDTEIYYGYYDSVDETNYIYSLYLTYTATTAGTYTLTLSSTNDQWNNKNMQSSIQITVLINSETVSATSFGVYNFNLEAGTIKIDIIIKQTAIDFDLTAMLSQSS